MLNNTLANDHYLRDAMDDVANTVEYILDNKE